MRSKLFFIGLLGLMMACLGCNTFRGAKDGFKEDWKAVAGADSWIQEHLW